MKKHDTILTELAEQIISLEARIEALQSFKDTSKSKGEKNYYTDKRVRLIQELSLKYTELSLCGKP